MLLEELQVATIRELEDLIIDAIYLDVLRGKLDQKEQQLEIEYTMGRDLEPGKLEKLLEALQNWSVPSCRLSRWSPPSFTNQGNYDGDRVVGTRPEARGSCHLQCGGASGERRA